MGIVSVVVLQLSANLCLSRVMYVISVLNFVFAGIFPSVVVKISGVSCSSKPADRFLRRASWNVSRASGFDSTLAFTILFLPIRQLKLVTVQPAERGKVYAPFQIDSLVLFQKSCVTVTFAVSWMTCAVSVTESGGKLFLCGFRMATLSQPRRGLSPGCGCG